MKDTGLSKGAPKWNCRDKKSGTSLKQRSRGYPGTIGFKILLCGLQEGVGCINWFWLMMSGTLRKG